MRDGVCHDRFKKCVFYILCLMLLPQMTRGANIDCIVQVEKLYSGIMITHCCFRLLHNSTVSLTDCLTFNLKCLNRLLAGRCHICKTMGMDFLHGQTVEFLQGRNFKPNFFADNECKRLCIATNSVFKLLTENFFQSMTLD